MLSTILTTLLIGPLALPVADDPVDQTPVARVASDEATVQLRCTVRVTGVIEDCIVIAESRPGIGFAQAALAMMDGAETEPGREAGRLVETQIDPQIVFTP